MANTKKVRTFALSNKKKNKYIKTNQIKQQIGRIVSFCKSIGIENEKTTENTNSIYLTSEYIKIRVSDHFGLPTEKVISIVVSSENQRQFIVSTPIGVFVLDGLSEVKHFIKNAYRCSAVFGKKDMDIRVKNMNLVSENRKLVKKCEKLLKETEKLERKYKSVV